MSGLEGKGPGSAVGPWGLRHRGVACSLTLGAGLVGLFLVGLTGSASGQSTGCQSKGCRPKGLRTPLETSFLAAAARQDWAELDFFGRRLGPARLRRVLVNPVDAGPARYWRVPDTVPVGFAVDAPDDARMGPDALTLAALAWAQDSEDGVQMLAEVSPHIFSRDPAAAATAIRAAARPFCARARAPLGKSPTNCERPHVRVFGNGPTGKRKPRQVPNIPPSQQSEPPQNRSWLTPFSPVARQGSPLRVWPPRPRPNRCLPRPHSQAPPGQALDPPPPPTLLTSAASPGWRLISGLWNPCPWNSCDSLRG